MHDVVVVGGSYAGMAAALQVARARRNVLVIDAGIRRNRSARQMHGLIGFDGRDPAELAERARAELRAYPTAELLEDRVARAERTDGGFTLSLESGARREGRRLVLALGVVDEFPDLPGVAERWGRSVFHCPYCHGYELDGGSIGVLATSPMSIHQALLLPDWGAVTYFTRGFDPSPEEREFLEARRVTVEAVAVTRLEDRATVRLADGRALAFAGLFLASRTRVPGTLVADLGLKTGEGPLGAFIETDAMKETSVRGVFACGDAAVAAGAVSLAIGDGFRTGTAAHRSLLFG